MNTVGRTNYTYACSEDADLVVARDMEKIVWAIHKHVGSVDAVILEGSYGRGEGAMIWVKDRWVPVNDYDICVVVNGEISSLVRENIKLDILQQSDISQIDLSFVSKSRLKKLRPRIINFDRKYGGQVIDGDDKVLALIPEFRSEQIPLFEAEKEFYTRMTAFILSMEVRYLNTELSIEEIFRIRQQMAKAMIACANAALIVRGQYHSSYRERLRRFTKLNCYDKNATKLIIGAFEFKTRPSKIFLPDTLSYYFACRDVYLKCFHQFVQIQYRKKFHGWSAYACKYVNTPRNILIRILQSCVGCSSHMQMMNLNLAQLFLVDAFGDCGLRDSVRKNKKFIDLMDIALGIKPKSEFDWDVIRMAILDRRIG